DATALVHPDAFAAEAVARSGDEMTVAVEDAGAQLEAEGAAVGDVGRERRRGDDAVTAAAGNVPATVLRHRHRRRGERKGDARDGEERGRAPPDGRSPSFPLRRTQGESPSSAQWIGHEGPQFRFVRVVPVPVTSAGAGSVRGACVLIRDLRASINSETTEPRGRAALYRACAVLRGGPRRQRVFEPAWRRSTTAT